MFLYKIRFKGFKVYKYVIVLLVLEDAFYKVYEFYYIFYNLYI